MLAAQPGSSNPESTGRTSPLERNQPRHHRSQAELERERFLAVGSDLQVIMGNQGYFHWVSPTFEQTLGWTTQEMTSRPWTEFVHPDDINLSEVEIASLFSGTETFAFENRYLHKDGSYRWLLWKAQPYPQEQAIYGAAVDITDRKKAEEKIREQAALIDISPDAILVRDLNSRIVFWNKGAEQMYGWTAAETLEQDSRDMLFKQRLPQLETAFQTVFQLGEWQGEFKKITKSGQDIQVNSRWKLLRDESGQPHAILSVETDITEQKQLEAQFLRAQRIESLGILAGGIAHDMNNLLTPMLASAQLLPMMIPTLNDQSRQLLSIFESNTKRGAELVQQILAFARGLEGDRMTVQVKHILTELVQIIKSTFPKSIEVLRDFSQQDSQQELWLVSANATQLHQVFMNFCVNARDAMPHGGKLSLSAENRVIDETYARMNLDAQIGPYVAISFKDTGTGIAPEHLDRIFEPFFTTKAVGEGTGLGLSTVMGIVKSHGGFVAVSSEVGKGTEFQIFLPAVEVTETAPEDSQEPFQGQGELILVVDDEANIRETLKMTLEEQNYQVLLAADGIEAIAIHAEHRNIQVILLDMMMPSMSGAKVIQVLYRFNPEIKIIACSGVPASESVLNMDGVKAFLQKPFTSDDLLNRLHQVIATN